MIKPELQAHERDAYEAYITTLINTPKDKKALKASLEKFVQGSPIYDALYLITMQKLNDGVLDEEDRKFLQKEF
jgi:hypothetical protein